MRVIAGEFKGRALKTTSGPGYRPAMGKVRQALFSMLEAREISWPSCRVLDLFAGSGSLGFEALSRGAAYVLFVETARKAAALIDENAQKFSLAPVRYAVRAEETRVVLDNHCDAPYQVIFIDPPYGKDMLGPSLRAVMRNGWLAANGVISAELEGRLAFSPEEAHPGLACIADRAYGQTRVILWTR